MVFETMARWWNPLRMQYYECYEMGVIVLCLCLDLWVKLQPESEMEINQIITLIYHLNVCWFKSNSNRIKAFSNQKCKLFIDNTRRGIEILYQLRLFLLLSVNIIRVKTQVVVALFSLILTLAALFEGRYQPCAGWQITGQGLLSWGLWGLCCCVVSHCWLSQC